ncbi:DUF4157 domain-containing protein [Rhodocytophaga rosea]|uniref:DUF4157 domain-containing protein n=1 Tax=Rhodocytophaga rosea TaxID=2704465 RepID=A0A6C0GSC4_9BACT|nr:DUF4157 domain-containing protein [Rhodocytophaga rosea]QHT70503.1 DUF4157 domain-containing protein [Rhodocytophaga rosea]
MKPAPVKESNGFISRSTLSEAAGHLSEYNAAHSSNGYGDSVMQAMYGYRQGTPFQTKNIPQAKSPLAFPQKQVSQVQHKENEGEESQVTLPSSIVPTKITIGSPDDNYEKEADAVANQVMQMPEAAVQRKCAHCQAEEKLLQRKALHPSPLHQTSIVQRKCAACEAEAGLLQRKIISPAISPFMQAKADTENTASESISQQIGSRKGNGSPLPGSTKSFIEERFGADFNDVRVHTDGQAIQLSQQLNAQAFATGNDIYFNQGKYSPESSDGKHLLAHELTHVVQQNAGIQQKTIQRDDKKPEESCTTGFQDGEGMEVNPPKNNVVYAIWMTWQEGDNREKRTNEGIKIWLKKRYGTLTPSLEGRIIDYMQQKFSVGGDELKPGCQYIIGLDSVVYDVVRMMAGEKRIDSGGGSSEGKGTGASGTGGKEKGKGSGTSTYNAFQSLKKEDKQKIRDLLKELVGEPTDNKQPDDKKVRLSKEEVALLLQLADDPHREEIIKQLKEAKGGNGEPASLETILATAKSKELLERMHESTGDKGQEPVENRPVRGNITHSDATIVPKKKVAFHFEVEDDRDALRVPWLSIRWHSELDPREKNNASFETFTFKENTNSHYSPIREQGILNDKYFHVEFPGEGTYVIEALVDHNFFLPNSFYIRVAVVDEKKVLKEKENEAYSGFLNAGNTKSHTFDEASFAYDEGSITTGTLDEKFKGATLDQQLKSLQEEKKRIEQLIKTYKEQNTSEAAAIISWAEKYLTKLSEYITKLESEGKSPDTHLVPCKGVYVSRTQHVRSDELKLSCFISKVLKKQTISDPELHQHETFEYTQYKAVLFDYTQLYENENYRVEEEADSAEKAFEKVFATHSTNYPNGTLSIAFQKWDQDTKQLTNEYITYGKVTDTVGKDIKGVLFSAPAQIAVNVVATLLTVFPPTSGIGLTIGILYNSANTISELQESADKGTLTGKKVAVGVGSIALDVIPGVGGVAKARRIITVGKKTYYAFQAAEKIGQAYLLYTGGVEEIEKVRDGVIKELAAINEEITTLERTNPSDPRLAELRKRQKKLIKEGREATANVLTNLVAQQGLMLVGTHILQEVAARKFGLNKLELEEKGLFKHEPGKKVQYDFEKQKITGDGNLGTPEEFRIAQKSAYYDQRIIQSTKLSPAERKQVIEKLQIHENVEIMKGQKTSLTREGDKWVLTVHENATVADIHQVVNSGKLAKAPEAPNTPAAKETAHEASKSGASEKKKETSPVKEVSEVPQTATKEHHEHKIHENGAISRCSDNCLPLLLDIIDRAKKLKKSLGKNHDASKEGGGLIDEAKAIEKEAKANAKKPDSPEKAAKETELLEQAKQLELKMAQLESTIIPELGKKSDVHVSSLEDHLKTHPEYENKYRSKFDRLKNIILEQVAKKDNANPSIREQAADTLRELNKELEKLNKELGKTIANVSKPDISKTFKYEEITKNGKTYKSAEGKLGIPDQVKQNRDTTSQSDVSKGTGDDAGHLIANLFGGAGGVENLSLQNWQSNEYGTWKQLENSWAEKLRKGVEIYAKVTDISKPGEKRPFMRRAVWTEKAPDGTITHHSLDFGNFHTPESRQKQNVPATVPEGNNAQIYDWNEERRKRGLATVE